MLDRLDSRFLDEGSGPAGAAFLLRRIHENVEFLGFRVTRMRWIAGAKTIVGFIISTPVTEPGPNCDWAAAALEQD